MSVVRVKLPSSSYSGAPVTLHDAAASFPQPTAAGGGGNIAGWRVDGFGPATIDISIRGSAACTMSGPLGIYGEKDNGEVGFLGYLNNAEAIRIQSATVGFNQQISAAGIFKYLLVGGVSATVTPSAGTITVKATPIIVMEY